MKMLKTPLVLLILLSLFALNGFPEDLSFNIYLEKLSEVTQDNGDHIPEPIPPPPIVRDFFQLDPFYEQWIDVEGLPVLASAKVNPYALKEAAWLIKQMIGHNPEIFRAMAENKRRFSVIAHTEIIIEIPEYRDDGRPDFLTYWVRGWGSAPQNLTVSSSEENILTYPGDGYAGYSVAIHELAHDIHTVGLDAVDPSFDERLRIAYDTAMEKGLWKGTYASSEPREYWAEGTCAWFYPHGWGSFAQFGDTRQALKEYDPGLAALLAEIYDDAEWRYTLPKTRTDQPHLRGFNPTDSPTFEGWPDLAALNRQLHDPNSDGGGEWINLKSFNPNQLPRLVESSVLGDKTTIIFVNLGQVNVFIYEVISAGKEQFWAGVPPGFIRDRSALASSLWLIKDMNGRKISLFRAKQKTGRAVIGIKDGREIVPVTLSQFRADHTDAGVLLKWTTESEVDNAGFYIYRSETEDGEYKVINHTMIQGADTTGERSEYAWTDTTANPNTVYYYRIEDVSNAGEREQLATVRLRGLISATGKLTTRWAELKMSD